MNRYLAQARTLRYDLLCFVAWGTIVNDSALKGEDIADVLNFDKVRFGLPFSEVWPKQMRLLEKLHVSLIFCMITLICRT